MELCEKKIWPSTGVWWRQLAGESELCKSIFSLLLISGLLASKQYDDRERDVRGSTNYLTALIVGKGLGAEVGKTCVPVTVAMLQFHCTCSAALCQSLEGWGCRSGGRNAIERFFVTSAAAAYWRPPHTYTHIGLDVCVCVYGYMCQTPSPLSSRSVHFYASTSG